LDLDAVAAQSPTVADILKVIEPDASKRIGHLQAGILAVMDQIRNLERGNRALAEIALERVDALHSFLLGLFQPPASYRPQGVPVMTEPALVMEIDHKA
jgi:hypothetical protein